MSAYYNEFDKEKAAVLREAIKAGAVAPGDVDERSIADVRAVDLMGYTQCHFFAGGGFWSVALKRAGWPDSRPAWTGSCPCQPHSAAASDKKRGFSDPRDLWPAWCQLIREYDPECVFGEQVDDSAMWIDRMHLDLEEAGFAVGTIDFPACAVDAPIERMRTYFVAVANGAGFSEQSRPVAVAQELIPVERSGRRSCYGDHATTGELGKRRRHDPGIRLLDHGYTGRVGAIRLAGDAIVVPQAQAFIESVMEVIG